MGDEIRMNGSIPVISIEADTLAEGFHNSMVANYKQGLRVETPKHQGGGSLGYDSHMTVRVGHPDKDPMINTAGLFEDPRGLMQYILEVTHGIHNHWKKNPDDPNDTRWGYTYNERFSGQIPFVFEGIKSDFESKGRTTGRDYFFSIWRSNEDSIFEQEDPPCWQNGQIRLVPDREGNLNLNYLTCWRSRDHAKAWLENNIAQVRLQGLFASKISNMLGVKVNVGPYIDTSTSLHIYGMYLDRDNLGKRLDKMADEGYVSSRVMSLNGYLGDEKELKRLISAQIDAETRGFGKNVPAERLKDEFGYDLDNFSYPGDWDSWPKEWDTKPDRSKLRS